MKVKRGDTDYNEKLCGYEVPQVNRGKKGISESFRRILLTAFMQPYQGLYVRTQYRQH